MNVTPLQLPGLLLIEPKRFADHRGHFCETYSSRAFARLGLHYHFVQDNHSLSHAKGTIRGLHFQSPPHAQDKLIQVLRGRILDVAVDIRKGSPGFGRHLALELSADNGRQLLVPAGFAHGFVTLEPETEVTYKVTAHYAPDCDAGILWNDPDLGIAWPVSAAEVRISPKDAALPRLADIESPFVVTPEQLAGAAS